MDRELEDAVEAYWAAAYNEGKYDLTTDDGKAQDALSRIQKGIGKLEARVAELEAGGWISCADRMPNKFTSVLGWFANGGYPVWAMHYDQEWCAELGMHELIFSDRDITHWKPIAAPKV